nr:ATP synthase F0 subunit 8 [Tomicus brevipilosus]
MPQMAPMNWLVLFIMFILLFILTMIINYFSFYYYPSKTNKNFLDNKNINWKW